jgi:hypothetical protein
MTTNEAPNTSTLILPFAPETQTVELAFFEPLGYAETLTAVSNLVAASPHASIAPLGQSFEGRNLHLVTVNDLTFPAAGKRRVWVHARVHAGEITSSHAMLGFLAQILEDSDAGRRLREHVIFTVVPQVNVDGIHRGYTRWDAQGIDQESEWCNIRVPEVALLKTRVDAFMTSANPISVALNLHSTVGNFTDSFFFKHVTPSVTANFETIQQNYINAVNAATPLFDNLSAQTSQLNACTFIESYFWNNWGESVMALTHEGHYYRRITDNAWTDGAHYREIGRALARALIQYYNLPPATTNQPGPVFSAQPAGQLLAMGQTLQLGATSTSAPPLSFQWWFNGAPVTAATNQTFTRIITNVTQAGAYAVVLTNASGAITSSLARVIVMDALGVPVAFADDFETDTAARWRVRPGAGNGVADYTAQFAFDYSTYFSPFITNNLPAAPNSAGGTTRGLRLTVNNNDATAATAAVSLFPLWQNFVGAHRLRCDLWINHPGETFGSGGAGSTEHATFGLDHSGDYVSWDSPTAAPSDGVWFSVTGEGGAANDYRAHVGGTNGAPVALAFSASGLAVCGATNASNSSFPFTSLFPSPPFQTPGVPGKQWVRVEVSQDAAQVLSWRLNDFLLAQRTNTSAFTTGNVMLGLMDIFTSIASPAADAFLLYDNVRVELDAANLLPVVISSPTNQTVQVGQTATFTGQAGGLGPWSYQWRRAGQPIAGATNATLTLADCQVPDAGTYAVEVQNAAGLALSAAATLTVVPGNTNSATLTAVASASTVQLAWPANCTGWRLEMQTNSLTGAWGTNWVTVPGSLTTNVMTLPVSAVPVGFFRLAYP